MDVASMPGRRNCTSGILVLVSYWVMNLLEPPVLRNSASFNGKSRCKLESEEFCEEPKRTPTLSQIESVESSCT